MSYLKQSFVLCLCIAFVVCRETPKDIEDLKAKIKAEEDAALKKLSKRQVIPPFGFGVPDYYNFILDYAAYDYYDWVCNGVSCQLCDILTGECCNPAFNENCFLPDSCANNPCLSGGTCTTTRTIDGRPDFVCACRPGLTGKYCQLVDDFALPPPIIPIPPPPVPAPVPGPQSYGNVQPPPPPPQAPIQSAGYGQVGPPPVQGGAYGAVPPMPFMPRGPGPMGPAGPLGGVGGLGPMGASVQSGFMGPSPFGARFGGMGPPMGPMAGPRGGPYGKK